MTYQTTLVAIENVTHDVKRLTFPRPDEFEFTPGQATELTLKKEGWTDEGRPFTMASAPDATMLEFVIKVYPDHDGVTEQIAALDIGDEVTLSEPFGAIEDKGHGVFLAGGAGITPFIPILRARRDAGQLDGCHLVFANDAARDIILRKEWEGIPNLGTTFLTSADDDMPDTPVTADLLRRLLSDDAHVYICGPQGFVDDIRNLAKELDVAEDRIVTEEGW